MQKQSGLRTLVSLLLLGATAAGLFNTYSDNAEVIALAETQVCGKPGCPAKKIREARNPLAQSFTFQLATQGKSVVADVECRRQYYLVGAYSCLASKL